MAHQINLATFGEELGKAYQTIINSNSKENWVLLGYDRNTNDLRMIAMVRYVST